MLAWLNTLKLSRRNVTCDLLPGSGNARSTDIATSDTGLPTAVFRPMTTPFRTGRSVIDPSPLLSTPVVTLYGRPDAALATTRNMIRHGSRSDPLTTTR